MTSGRGIGLRRRRFRQTLSGGGGRVGRAFEGGAVPVGEAGAGFVGALAKIEQRAAGGWSRAHVFIHEEEFAELLVIESRFRLHERLGEPLRLRSHVGVKRRVLNVAATWPEADAAHFVGVGFGGDNGGGRAVGCAAAGKAGDGEVEAAPEEMYRTD